MKPGSTCDIYTEPLINKLRGKRGGWHLTGYLCHQKACK